MDACACADTVFTCVGNLKSCRLDDNKNDLEKNELRLVTYNVVYASWGLCGSVEWDARILLLGYLVAQHRYLLMHSHFLLM